MLRSTFAAWRRSLVYWLLWIVSLLDPAPDLLEVERAQGFQGFDEPMPSDWPAIARELRARSEGRQIDVAMLPLRPARWLREALADGEGWESREAFQAWADNILHLTHPGEPVPWFVTAIPAEPLPLTDEERTWALGTADRLDAQAVVQ